MLTFSYVSFLNNVSKSFIWNPLSFVDTAQSKLDAAQGIWEQNITQHIKSGIGKVWSQDNIFVEVSPLSTHEVHKMKRQPLPKSEHG